MKWREYVLSVKIKRREYVLTFVFDNKKDVLTKVTYLESGAISWFMAHFMQGTLCTPPTIYFTRMNILTYMPLYFP